MTRLTKAKTQRILEVFRRGWNMGTVALACEVTRGQVEQVIRAALIQGKAQP